MKSVKEFLESKKYDSELSNEELASISGISVDSLRSIFKGETISQLILIKVMGAFGISLAEAKKKFSDFKFTRETIKGIKNEDYILGEQNVSIEEAEVISNNRKSIRVVLKNKKYTYVTTIPIYDVRFDDFERTFNLNILSTGIKDIIGKAGKIKVIDDNSDILTISFRGEEDE